MIAHSRNFVATEYCKECGESRSCNNYHVYLIELNRIVLEKKTDFPYTGVLPNDKKVFYVGITKHKPECRYVQHTADRPDNKEYQCSCFTDTSVSRKFPKKVKFVHGYNLKLVKLADVNPIVRTDGPTFPGSATKADKEAKKYEKDLGESLRKAGFAVYWN